MLGTYGQPSHTAQDARNIALKTGGVAVSAASTTAALAAAAGFATVPVAGWVVAAGIVVTTAVIQLVTAIRQGNMRKAEAVRKAKELGLPDAALVPAFTVKALESTPEWREREVRKLLKRRGRRKLVRGAWRDRKLDTKLELIAAVAKVDAAASTMQMAPAAPSSDIQPADLPTPAASPWPLVAMLGGGVALVLVLATAGKES